MIRQCKENLCFQSPLGSQNIILIIFRKILREGYRQKLKKGLWPQIAQLGYLNNKATKKFYVPKEKAPLIKKAFMLYATGKYTFKGIRKIINEHGLRDLRYKMLSVSNYQYLLQNSFYYGLISYKGEYFEGKHKPIITKTF